MGWYQPYLSCVVSYYLLHLPLVGVSTRRHPSLTWHYPPLLCCVEVYGRFGWVSQGQGQAVYIAASARLLMVGVARPATWWAQASLLGLDSMACHAKMAHGGATLGTVPRHSPMPFFLC